MSGERLKEALGRAAREIGFTHIGFATAEPIQDYHRYQEWIARGDAGDLWYLTEKSRMEKRADPRHILPGARTVIVGAVTYAPRNPPPPSDAKFARYLWGTDYHGWLKEMLEKLVAHLREETAEAFSYLTYVDTGPLLERSLAREAGVGWIGKNTCLIREGSGSYLLLGEILLTLSLPPDPPALDRCGSCTRCLDACPTGALPAPYRLVSEKCISYQTLENRAGDIPESVSRRMEGWVAGCDICQEVCPWNREPALAQLEQLVPLPHLNLTLKELGELGEAQYKKVTQSTSLKRVKWLTFKRNVCAAARFFDAGPHLANPVRERMIPGP